MKKILVIPLVLSLALLVSPAVSAQDNLENYVMENEFGPLFSDYMDNYDFVTREEFDQFENSVMDNISSVKERLGLVAERLYSLENGTLTESEIEQLIDSEISPISDELDGVKSSVESMESADYVTDNQLENFQNAVDASLAKVKFKQFKNKLETELNEMRRGFPIWELVLTISIFLWLRTFSLIGCPVLNPRGAWA